MKDCFCFKRKPFFFFLTCCSVIAKLFCEERLVKITFHRRQRAQAGDWCQKLLDTVPYAGTGFSCPCLAPTVTSHPKRRGWGGTKPLCPSSDHGSQHLQSYEMPPSARLSSHVFSLHSCSPAAFPGCCSWLFLKCLGSQVLSPSQLPTNSSMYWLWQPI